MNIRTVALAKDSDFRSYLADAEKSIDAMSDEELDLYEKELEASIRRLIHPKPALHLVGATPRKRKVPTAAWPALSGLLIAALALFFMRTAEQEEQVPHWTTKGTTDLAPIACSIALKQPQIGSAELSEAGYLVKSAAPVYLKTSCEKDLAIEALENGVWVAKLKVEVKEGYLVRTGELVDLRKFVGVNLRIHSQEGLSEEFVLTEAR